MLDEPCVVFALRRESRPFYRAFRPHQTINAAPCPARFCGEPPLRVVAVETGAGLARTEKVLTWLMNKPPIGQVPYRPKVVLGTGFCGALRDGLRTGDAVWATEVIDAASGTHWPTTWTKVPTDPGHSRLHCGRLVTVARLAGDPQQKHKLGRDWNAAAVDMESAVLARICAQSEVPFGCMRVVLDTAETSLSPRLIHVVSDGHASTWRLATTIASAPALTLELCRLAKQSRLAAEALAVALREILVFGFMAAASSA
jgi:hypothetical protein